MKVATVLDVDGVAVAERQRRRRRGGDGHLRVVDREAECTGAKAEAADIHDGALAEIRACRAIGEVQGAIDGQRATLDGDGEGPVGAVDGEVLVEGDGATLPGDDSVDGVRLDAAVRVSDGQAVDGAVDDVFRVAATVEVAGRDVLGAVGGDRGVVGDGQVFDPLDAQRAAPAADRDADDRIARPRRSHREVAVRITQIEGVEDIVGHAKTPRSRV